jgi:hypothetical protein
MQMLRRWDNNCAHEQKKLLTGEYLGFSSVSVLLPPILFHAPFLG